MAATNRSIRVGCSDGRNEVDRLAAYAGLKTRQGVSPEKMAILALA